MCQGRGLVKYPSGEKYKTAAMTEGECQGRAPLPLKNAYFRPLFILFIFYLLFSVQLLIRKAKRLRSIVIRFVKQ